MKNASWICWNKCEKDYILNKSFVSLVSIVVIFIFNINFQIPVSISG